jgi:predicted membrane protein
MNYLTKEQENFCNNAGLAGLLITVTCLLQHLVVMATTWVAFSIIPIYLLTIGAFLLLMRQSQYAQIFLIISTSLIFLLELFLIYNMVYTLVLLILLIYCVIILTLILTSNLPGKLRLKALAAKKEEQEWDGKI